MACEGTLFVGGKAKYGVKDKLDEFVTTEARPRAASRPHARPDGLAWPVAA